MEYGPEDKRRPPAKINILEDRGIIYLTTPEICEKIASTFEAITKPTNYDPSFRNYKVMKEEKNINLALKNLEVYNREISKAEMVTALASARNITPGQDNISYEMLRQLPEQAAKYLLKIYKLFKENIFPRQWRESIIIPIPKPNKNLSSPTNYRPISLTSTICKTLERILNSRLQDYLSGREFAQIQTGAMKRRLTLDHLTGLETTVRNAFAHGEPVISVFFDLEKAYHLTWEYGIVKDLHRIRLRGRLPLFIQNFLADRKFRVKVSNTVSQSKNQEHEIPQGSMLSVTLFIINMDEITRLISRDSRFHSSLYKDDLQIAYRHTDLHVMQQNLQDVLDQILE